MLSLSRGHTVARSEWNGHHLLLQRLGHLVHVLRPHSYERSSAPHVIRILAFFVWPRQETKRKRSGPSDVLNDSHYGEASFFSTHRTVQFLSYGTRLAKQAPGHGKGKRRLVGLQHQFLSALQHPDAHHLLHAVIDAKDAAAYGVMARWCGQHHTSRNLHSGQFVYLRNALTLALACRERKIIGIRLAVLIIVRTLQHIHILGIGPPCVVAVLILDPQG